jgi:hypothetical protein
MHSAKKNKEPKQLRRGKMFHARIQADWAGTIEGSQVINEHGINLGIIKPSAERIRRGRIDIYISKMDDFVSVVEIKSTNWDKIKKANRKKLMHSHCAQTLRYVDKYLQVDKVNVCAGIIYPKSPGTPGLKTEIENYFNEQSFQVVWYDDNLTFLR